MIGFRDEEPTYAQAALAAAEHLEGIDPGGKCRACQLTVDDCDRYSVWCLGRTARATRPDRTGSTSGWREQFLDQLEQVVAMHDWFPNSVAIPAEAEALVRHCPHDSDTVLLGKLVQRFPKVAAADLTAALWKARGRE